MTSRITSTSKSIIADKTKLDQVLQPDCQKNNKAPNAIKDPQYCAIPISQPSPQVARDEHCLSAIRNSRQEIPHVAESSQKPQEGKEKKPKILSGKIIPSSNQDDLGPSNEEENPDPTGERHLERMPSAKSTNQDGEQTSSSLKKNTKKKNSNVKPPHFRLSNLARSRLAACLQIAFLIALIVVGSTVQMDFWVFQNDILKQIAPVLAIPAMAFILSLFPDDWWLSKWITKMVVYGMAVSVLHFSGVLNNPVSYGFLIAMMAETLSETMAIICEYVMKIWFFLKK